MAGQPEAARDILDKLNRKQLKADDDQGVLEITQRHGQAKIAADIKDKQHFLWSRPYR